MSPSSVRPAIAVLSGGVGAARMLRALGSVADPSSIVAVVNTGDDTVLHGLQICPDLDTIVYTLAGAIDPGRGWGLVDETWHALDALGRYARARPDGSAAGDTWFGLGDRDLATHLYRTGRLAEGATLAEVTDEIRRAWEVPTRLVPMCDEPAPTVVHLADGTSVSFQEYFVRLRHDVAIRGVTLGGAGQHPHPEALSALSDAPVVVIAPSNPVVSVGPIRSLAGVDAALAARRSSVVAVSPIVGGAALKGPADRMLTELGIEASVVGVAELYAPVAGHLVIDPLDAHLAAEVARRGIRPVVQPSVMSDPEVAATLARATVDSALN